MGVICRKCLESLARMVRYVDHTIDDLAKIVPNWEALDEDLKRIRLELTTMEENECISGPSLSVLWSKWETTRSLVSERDAAKTEKAREEIRGLDNELFSSISEMVEMCQKEE